MSHKLVAMFVRHGSTQLNDQGKFRGPLDVDLDERERSRPQRLPNTLREGLLTVYS